MHSFSLLEIKSREKRFLLWNELLFQAKLKKKSVENFTVSTIPADGILWIQLPLGIYSCTVKFMSLSASGMQYWSSQDLWLWQLGHRDFPPRHKSWKSSQAPPFPPAIIPLYQKNPGPNRAQSRSMFGSFPPGPSSGPPNIAYPECGCQLGFLQNHEFASHTMFVLICTFVTLYFYLCRSYHPKLLF